MKKLFCAIAALAIFASCSKTEVVDRSDAIKFDGVFYNNSVITKADPTDLGTSVELKIWSYDGTSPVINGDKLAYSTAWKTTGTYYWPADATELKSIAVAPHSLGAESTASNAATFTMSTNLNNDTDDYLLGTATTAKSSPIVFTLDHILTQVIFKAQLKTSSPTDHNVKDVVVTVKSALPQGTYTYSGTHAWTASGTAADVAYTKFTGNIGTNLSPSTIGAKVFVPQDGLTVNIKGDAYDAGNNKISSFDQDYTVANGAWAPGTSITYTLIFDPTGNTEEITFGTPQVNDWTNTTGSVDVP